MNRLGLLSPSELTPAQQEAYETIRAYTESNYGKSFMTMDSQSRLIGPFGIQLHCPQIAKVFVDFATALRTLPGLAPEVRECAILGVGCRLRPAYEQYAHNQLSGFSREEQRMLEDGQCPAHFSRAQKTAYKIAIVLGNPGPLSSEDWDEAVEVLGRDGAATLIHYVGFYCYVSTILNGFDAKVPQ